MENKYYVPTIEEFYEGFEFELGLRTVEFKIGMNGLRCSDSVITKDWVTKKYEVAQFTENNIEPERITAVNTLMYYINSDDIRVKYLNKQDIESLGFRQTQEIPHWFELKSKIQPGSYRLIYTYLEVGEEVLTGVSIIYFKGDYADPIVRGITIKNKSELKRLLAQLNIE
jgi:hypothetical protein